MRAGGRAVSAALLLLVATWPCHAWVLFPAQLLRDEDVEIETITELVNHANIDGRPPVYRWSVAPTLRSEYGLGGGITYAYDEEFCADMVPKFAEGNDLTTIKAYEFVNCDAIKAVMQNAFATWEGNNRNIYFTDVTSICTGEDMWEDVPDAACTSTRCRTCPLAEIVISLFQSTPEDHSGARVVPEAIASKPLSTNNLKAGGGSLRNVELQFGTDLCWYIDATFCSLFHTMEANGLPVVAIVGVVLGVLFLFSAIITVYAVFQLTRIFIYNMLIAFDADQDGVVDLEEIINNGGEIWRIFKQFIKTRKISALDELEKFEIELDDALFAVSDVFLHQFKLSYVVLVIFGLLLPMLLLHDVFLPCWECYDFEAAAVHEIGHVLGFDHPDQFPEYNFVSDRDAYNCSAPWGAVSKDDGYDANSVMQAFLPRNPKTCLTEDDLDGLNFLYPVCSDNLQVEPVCIKGASNIGYPRLLQATLSAELIAVLIVLALKGCSWAILECKDEVKEKKTKADMKKASMESEKKLQRLDLVQTQVAQRRNARLARAASRPGGGVRRPKTAPDMNPPQTAVGGEEDFHEQPLTPREREQALSRPTTAG